MVNEVHEGVKILLETSSLHQRNQAVLGFRNTPLGAILKALEALWACLILCHHRYPVVHDGIHGNVKDSGREGVALCHPAEDLERGAMISYILCYHVKTSPVCL